MKKCPTCQSTRFKQGPYGKVCKKCGYRNDPRYLNRKIEEFEKK